MTSFTGLGSSHLPGVRHTGRDHTTPDTSDDQALRDAARKLESRFVTEMLKSAGMGKSRDNFGGGPGEEGFTTFLLNAQADQIVAAGGFGLAEQIFESLKRAEGNAGDK